MFEILDSAVRTMIITHFDHRCVLSGKYSYKYYQRVWHNFFSCVWSGKNQEFPFVGEDYPILFVDSVSLWVLNIDSVGQIVAIHQKKCECIKQRTLNVCKWWWLVVQYRYGTYIARHYYQNATFDSDDIMSKLYTCLIALHF